MDTGSDCDHGSHEHSRQESHVSSCNDDHEHHHEHNEADTEVTPRPLVISPSAHLLDSAVSSSPTGCASPLEAASPAHSTHQTASCCSAKGSCCSSTKAEPVTSPEKHHHKADQHQHEHKTTTCCTSTSACSTNADQSHSGEPHVGYSHGPSAGHRHQESQQTCCSTKSAGCSTSSPGCSTSIKSCGTKHQHGSAPHSHNHSHDDESAHGHGHGHNHGHDHDDGHEHGHNHNHKHDNKHSHARALQPDYKHNHAHGPGHNHDGNHEHDHGHNHKHDQDHSHSHADACCASEHDHEHEHAEGDHGHSHSGAGHVHGDGCCSSKQEIKPLSSVIVEARKLLQICCDMCWTIKSDKCSCVNSCCAVSCCITQMRATIASVLSRSSSSASSSALTEESKSVISKGRLMVTGMDCSSCSQSVEQKLLKMTGVTAASVSAMTGVAEITYDSSTNFTLAAAIHEVETLGYKATEMEQESVHSVEFSMVLSEYADLEKFVIEKMAARAVLLLVCQPGVFAESVVHRFDVKTGQRNIRAEFDPSVTGPRKLLNCLIANGCNFQVASSSSSSTGDSIADLKRQWGQRFWLSLLFCVPVIFIAFIFPAIGGSVEAGMDEELTEGLDVSTLLLFLLASPIQLLIAGPLYESAYRSLRYSRSANADLLVVLSTGVAYFYSVISVIVAMSGAQFTDENFFETSAVLLTLIIFGRYLEALAKGKTSEVLERLQAMTVTQALLMDGYDEQTNVSASESLIDMALIERGDIIKVLPGARVATDGVIVWGSTMIDESMVTGESVPVNKSVGDAVLSSTVNKNGVIHVRVTRASKENTLSSITRLVQEAQNSQPPVQRIADRVAGWFVPSILALTLGVFAVWLGIGLADLVDTDDVGPVTFALRFAIATLIISCPCAIGLAVPTAIMCGSGMAAQHGVVFKSGATIERCAKVTAMVVDKTGTLTYGRPSVSSFDALNASGTIHPNLWLFVGAAESGSEHPLAAALLSYARTQLGYGADSDDRFPAPEQFVSVPGCGIRCEVDGHRVCIGTLPWIQEHITVSEAQISKLAGARPSAETSVLVTIDDELQAVIRLMDGLRPDARQLVDLLRDLKIETWMCSGDSQATAQVVGEQAGLLPNRVLGGQLPGDKAGLIRKLQSQGHVVAMLGDGINDSVALAQADVGMAVAQGTDIAGEAAHVLLVKDDLLDVALALHLARRTFQTIRWNFTWAFIYNFLAIPIAMGVFYPLEDIQIPPPLAGLSELLSSLPVIVFSLMLRFYKPPKQSVQLSLINQALYPDQVELQDVIVETAK